MDPDNVNNWPLAPETEAPREAEGGVERTNNKQGEVGKERMKKLEKKYESQNITNGNGQRNNES